MVMKAAQLIKYGGQDAIQTQEAPRPVPAEGEVLIEVHAAGVNPFDVKVREGKVRGMAELDLPATLGGDFAGVVSELGRGVSGFEPGQAVYGQAGALSGRGSFAEFTPVKAEQLAPKPNAVDFVEAAGLPLVGSSAYQALVDHMDLQAGQKILIHGGAGGIGSIAVQLAKHLGAYVAATAGADDVDFVKNLGADEVVDYRSQDFSELIHGYDAVYDTVGGETNRRSYAVLRPGGALVSMAAKPDEELVKKYGIKYVSQFTRTTTERLGKVAELVDSGTLKPYVDKVFVLEQAAEAVEYIKSGHHRGKVIIEIKK